MQKLVERALSAETVTDELIQHFSSKGDAKQVKVLTKAKSLLNAVFAPQHERCVPDAQAGAIATLIAAKCVNRSRAVLVMVTESTGDSPGTKAKIGALPKTVGALKELGYLPNGFKVDFKRPDSGYICSKRLDNASANGNDIPPELWKAGVTDRLDWNFADKICVKVCGKSWKSCRYHLECHYRVTQKELRSGAIQVQIYGVTQYRDALRKGALPKSRMTVYTPATRLVLLETLDYALYADDLLALANDCEKRCTTVKSKQKLVAQPSKVIRDRVCELCDGVTGDAAKTCISEIKQAISDIQRVCAPELRKYKLRRIEVLLHTSVLQINRILERGTYFALCYGNQTDQIQIGGF